ncbi:MULTISPECIES: septal ring lytic transglycosylase RlpA family protein [Pontibacter]|uniref:Probable endolytic peptidoglycan transglycosylase RlpA n=1 Tax=Pontibacter lucknowensis TaxID=1077936 RepID=A0A1N6UUE0_9BACT|nr:MULTISPECIES: septal ring lytic transglycosylase RlpA family protein [Pontibacter]EJF09619.1 rare lipoprotein A [Pontibacter sp. BAB1700]SIQ69275.1 rare lipoprotein A [Pontibacter lucknowensis]
MRLKHISGTLLIAALLTTSACTTSKPAPGQRGYTEAGKASYYSNKLHGRKMANGEAYNRRKLTAAHRTLPFGTKVKVTNLQTNKSVKVSITDRGPFVKGRVIDLSEAAAKRLDYISAGIVPVEVKVVKPAPVR